MKNKNNDNLYITSAVFIAQRLVGQLTKTKSSNKPADKRQTTLALRVHTSYNSFSPMYLYTSITVQDQVSIGGFLLIHKLLLDDLYTYNN